MKPFSCYVIIIALLSSVAARLSRSHHRTLSSATIKQKTMSSPWDEAQSSLWNSADRSEASGPPAATKNIWATSAQPSGVWGDVAPRSMASSSLWKSWFATDAATEITRGATTSAVIIGGCAGTQFGCCLDYTTAKSIYDACKTNSAIDCEVSSWAFWSECTIYNNLLECTGTGPPCLKTRTRSIVTHASSTGSPCPVLADIKACNLERCDAPPLPTPLPTRVPTPLPTPNAVIGGCAGTQFGCCQDDTTAMVDANGSNCGPTPCSKNSDCNAAVGQKTTMFCMQGGTTCQSCTKCNTQNSVEPNTCGDCGIVSTPAPAPVNEVNEVTGSSNDDAVKEAASNPSDSPWAEFNNPWGN